MTFYKVGPGAYVAEDHIERVDFKSDGSAVVHTTTNNVTVTEKDHVVALKQFVGVGEKPAPVTGKPKKEEAKKEE